MLVRFSVALKGGIEVITYETKRYDQLGVNQELFAGFLEAIQMLSETMGKPIRKIQFADLMLYVQSYGDYTLRLMVEENLEEAELTQKFRDLSKQTSQLLPILEQGRVLNKTKFNQYYLPIIQTWLGEEELFAENEGFAIEKFAKIAILGLGKAGKTSIKRRAFEKWSKEQALNTKPTLGIERTHKAIDILQEKLMVLDFGGQESFRKRYLKQDLNWKNISAVIYVVDVQNKESFVESKQYLEQIWQKILELNTRRPRISIFLHKYDNDLRQSLKQNVSECVNVFEQFHECASFHLTTIEDSSAINAFIKALYLSLPDIMIKRILQEEVIGHFEKELLPKFISMYETDMMEEISEETCQDIRRTAIMLGRTYSSNLQNKWLNYITGTWEPEIGNTSNIEMSIEYSGKYLSIKFPQIFFEKYPEEFIKLLLGGLIEGITKTLFLNPPEPEEMIEGMIVWRIKI